ncbi:hypothetical protein [Nonomuraea sp. NPDC049480]|uniref:hypothetical protein n=1 Tax=Nonomuraea sp. NPDC049480 TaxID=3364353 RepID=UPI0037BB8196
MIGSFGALYDGDLQVTPPWYGRSCSLRLDRAGSAAMVDLGFVGPSRPAQDYRFVKVTDGDTPTIEMSIRMVSIDTPESEFGGLLIWGCQAI